MPAPQSNAYCFVVRSHAGCLHHISMLLPCGAGFQPAAPAWVSLFSSNREPTHRLRSNQFLANCQTNDTSTWVIGMLASIHRTPQFRIALMLTPALVLVGVLFLGGLLVAVGQSLGYFSVVGNSGFTLSHYEALLNDREFRRSLVLTLLIATASTLVCSIAGLGLALVLPQGRHNRILSTLLQVPI